MFERITELMSSQTTLNDISGDLDALTTTENELSSGLKINEPSDDPYGASVVVDLNSQLSQITNYQNNITDANGYLSAAGGALTNINNMVNTIRELAVEGANGTENTSDDQDEADEVNQLISAITQATQTTYNGNSVFSATPATRTIGPDSQTVQVNTDLTSLLGNGTSDTLLLSTLNKISSDLSSGNTTGLGTTDLQNLDANLSTLQSIQANAGALTNRLTEASSALTTLQSTDHTQLANTQDVNMAQAATTYSTEQASYTAALQSGAQIVQESLLNFLTPG
ncbi:MAG: hypothetical protein ABSG64_09740 [Solirubrobacteraceae bacterium]|jgi:flagellar hook-associated protein 3 FlgL